VPSAGKTSIARVVFAKLPAHETIFLEPSQHVAVYSVATNPYVQASSQPALLCLRRRVCPTFDLLLLQFALWDWPACHSWAGGRKDLSSVAASSYSSSVGATGFSRGGTTTLPSLKTSLSAVVFRDPAEDDA
jgi:hypothetical protein